MTRLLSQLTTVSVVALGVALAGPLRAKGFLGSYTVNGGSVSISESGTTTDFNVLSPQVVIDWVPDDNAPGTNPITFLDSNGIATFRGFSDYAVLNRIGADPGRAILLNGTISSTINSNPGGAVYFYSPSGFIVGANARIDVGSLVLSASPIAVDGNGGFSNGGVVGFGQAPNPNALIATQAGSQINAFGSGAYVAMVAPSIRHQGTISTDRGVALVAAEAATITFSPDGLYNIQVMQGTDAAIGVDVDGGTIQRRDPTEGTNHYAYLVTVARNDAVEMLVRNGGSVGFDTATSAVVENNVVVLSGGYDVTGGQALSQVNVRPVNLSVDQGLFSSNVDMDLTGGADIRSISGVTEFDRNLSIAAGGNITIQAANGNDLLIGGNLLAQADRFGGGVAVTGHTVQLQALGGSTLSVGGNAGLSAKAFGASSTDDGLTATNATGGTVALFAQGTGSTITVGGNLSMAADAEGGNVFFGTGTGGTATGGKADILANLGGAVSVAGTTSISVNAIGGGTGEGIGDQVGANGTGGDIRINAAAGSGNSITLTGAIDIFASGSGGAGGLATGNGRGGTLNIFADSGAITIGGALNALIDGSGGFGFDTAVGGAGTGGTLGISFGVGGGSMTFADIDLQAFGGFGLGGGLGRGGGINISTANSGAMTANGAVNFGADGSGGGSGGTGDGGNSEGGNFFLQTQGGTISFASDVSASTDAQGGSTESGGDGGDAVAGRTQMFANGGGTLTVGADLTLRAVSQGGFGVNGGNALAFIGSNPRATATTDARLIARNGSITVGGFTDLNVNSLGAVAQK